MPSSFREGARRFLALSRSYGGRLFGTSLAASVSALVGYALNVTLLRSRYLYTTYESTSFIRIYRGIFYERAADLIGCFLELFGYIPERSVLSLRGFVTLLAFVLIGCCFWVAVRTGRLLGGGNVRERAGEMCGGKGCGAEGTDSLDRLRLPLRLFWSSLGVMTFFLLFTDTTLTPRYFLMSVYLLAPVMAVWMTQERAWAKKALFLFGFGLALLISCGKITYSLAQTDKNASRREAAEFLAEHGYAFGFSLYEDANLLQELTDGRVEAGAVLDPESLTFFRWSTAERYYEQGYSGGKVFLLVPDYILYSYGGAEIWQRGREIYNRDGYVIYEFEDDSVFFERAED